MEPPRKLVDMLATLNSQIKDTEDGTPNEKLLSELYGLRLSTIEFLHRGFEQQAVQLMVAEGPAKTTSSFMSDAKVRERAQQIKAGLLSMLQRPQPRAKNKLALSSHKCFSGRLPH